MVAAIALEIDEDESKIQTKNVDWVKAIIEKGVIVDLHIGRTRFERKMTSADLGLDIDDSNFQNFVTQYLDLGSKMLAPKKVLSKFDSIESRARANLYRHAFDTPYGLFVPFTAYNDWKKENTTNREDYFQALKELEDGYASMVLDILAEYRDAAVKLYERTDKSKSLSVFTETLVKNIESQIPSLESVVESFYYGEDIYYVPIPTELAEENLKMAIMNKEASIKQAESIAEVERIKSETQMHKDVLQKLKETKTSKIDGMLDSISNQLSSAIYGSLADVLNSIKKNSKLNQASEKKLRDLVTRTKMMNFNEVRFVSEQPTQ